MEVVVVVMVVGGGGKARESRWGGIRGGVGKGNHEKYDRMSSRYSIYGRGGPFRAPYTPNRSMM